MELCQVGGISEMVNNMGDAVRGRDWGWGYLVLLDAEAVCVGVLETLPTMQTLCINQIAVTCTQVLVLWFPSNGA